MTKKMAFVVCVLFSYAAITYSAQAKSTPSPEQVVQEQVDKVNLEWKENLSEHLKSIQARLKDYEAAKIAKPVSQTIRYRYRRPSVPSQPTVPGGSLGRRYHYPNNPYNPIYPDQPGYPYPNNPYNPIYPDQPGYPNSPYNPVYPDQPGYPYPNNPYNPIYPDQPGYPYPYNPVYPGQPGYPSNPSQPTQPVSPVQPNPPTQPTQPVSPISPGPSQPTQPVSPGPTDPGTDLTTPPSEDPGSRLVRSFMIVRNHLNSAKMLAQYIRPELQRLETRAWQIQMTNRPDSLFASELYRAASDFQGHVNNIQRLFWDIQTLERKAVRSQKLYEIAVDMNSIALGLERMAQSEIEPPAWRLQSKVYSIDSKLIGSQARWYATMITQTARKFTQNARDVRYKTLGLVRKTQPLNSPIIGIPEAKKR